jgi:hypothetical protein
MLVGGGGGGGRKGRTTRYGRFLDAVMGGRGEDDDTWAFSRPGDGEREGRNVVGIAWSKEEKRLVCTTLI